MIKYFLMFFTLVLLTATFAVSASAVTYITTDFSKPELGRQIPNSDAFLQTNYKCSNPSFIPSFGGDTLTKLNENNINQTQGNQTQQSDQSQGYQQSQGTIQ